MAVRLRRYKSSESWVGDYYPDGRSGKRVRITLDEAKTRDEAEQALQRLIEDSREVRTDLSVDSTIAALFPKYMKDHAELNFQSRTISDVQAVFDNHLSRILGATSVDGLTTQDIIRYKKIRKAEFVPSRAKSPERRKVPLKPISNRTINKELDYLAGFVTWAKKEYGFELKDFRIDPLPYSRPLPIILSFEEAIAFLEAAEPFYRALFGCLYMMGLRINEARQLTRDAVDLEQAVMLVKRKGSRHQILHIPPILVEFLRAIPDSGDYVFESKRVKGRPFSAVRNAIARTAKKAGIKKKIYPHLLRHTYATHMVILNESIKKVSELMGHGQVSTTEWYTHIASAFLKESGNKLNAILEALRKKRLRSATPRKSAGL